MDFTREKGAKNFRQHMIFGFKGNTGNHNYLAGKKRKTKAARDSSSSLASTTSPSEESSSTEEERQKRTKKKKKQRRKAAGGDIDKEVLWELVNDMWPLEQRPAHLQDKNVCHALGLKAINEYKTHYNKEAEEKGIAAAAYGKDPRPRVKKFKGGRDDGMKKLLPSRFEVGPLLCAPKKYWEKVPLKRALYRHLPLAHLGLESHISEKVILSMHDRRNVIKLEMFCKTNAGRDKTEKADWTMPGEIRQLQEALLAYTAVTNTLWPMDYSPTVISKVNNPPTTIRGDQNTLRPKNRTSEKK